MKVDRVGELQGEGEARVAEPDAGEKCLLIEAQLALPTRVAKPAELVLHPDANPKCMSLGVVLLANMRPVDVADLVGLVEVDQQAPVANRKVAWHRPLPNKVGIATVRPPQSQLLYLSSGLLAPRSVPDLLNSGEDPPRTGQAVPPASASIQSRRGR